MNTGYRHGAGDSCLYEKRAWFDDPYSTELLAVSRPFGSSDDTAVVFSEEEMEKRSRQLDLDIERQVIWRAVPYYAKQITIANNMTVGM